MKGLVTLLKTMAMSLVISGLALTSLCPGRAGVLPAEGSDSATVSGTVLDRKTGEPLQIFSYWYVEAHRWDGTAWWLEGVFAFSRGAKDYNLELKNPGEYCFFMKANGYIHEYYKNAKNPDKKIMITIKPGDKISLDTVYLDPMPIIIKNYKMQSGNIGKDGGKVLLTADMVNNTPTKRVALVWPILSSSSTQFGSTIVHGSFDVSVNQEVTVESGETKPFEITFDVPMKAIPAVYCVNLYTGYSKWHVMYTPPYGICFQKTEDNSIEVMPEKVMAEPMTPRPLPGSVPP